MSTEKFRRVGLDPGFGGLKVAEVRAGADGERELVSFVLPSVIGVGSTNVGALNLAGVVRSGRRGRRPYVLALDGGDGAGAEYLVGHGVAEFARPIERMDFARFTEGPELRALFYAALYELLDGGCHRVGLAIGMPVEILQDKAQASATERAMAKWLMGRHHFRLDGVEAEFEVVALRAKIAQPLATWFDWGLNLEGQWIRGKAAVKAPTLVIDQGFNTLDLAAVEDGRVSARYSGGDTLGMRRAAEMTQRNVERRYGVELSLHEADALVQALIGGRRSVDIYVEGQLTSATAEVRQAIDALGADVIRFVERSVGKGRKFRILLAGGGALALAPRLLRQWPHAVVAEDPVMSNARGLAKLAAREHFLA